ncbi:MAG TPA: heavy metal translocating P-type ATPase metal-binding domain-containing protein [Verrucomicrobiae bacterium]|nr:heavy metal translocating P-type ATPase metal-binding domain-containing protein [Verrucomicrobiae bacterium]
MNITMDASATNVAVGAPSRGASKERVSCFHCGDICTNTLCARGEKVFCCQGCLTVHDLLAENGLEHFYALNSHPGVRGRGAKREQWAFLDEPALQQKLIDFTDGTLSRATFRIPAIHCVACVWLLENLFRLHPGIGNSQVNFLKREATVCFTPQKIALSEVVTLLASIGYEPVLTLGELGQAKPASPRKRQWVQIGIAGFAFGNIMLFSLPAYLGLDAFNAPVFHRLFNYLSLALALPVLIYSAADYWKSALLSVRQRVLTLDVPIALGLAALYGQSLLEISSGRGEGYLDSLVGLIFFLLCGRAFQQKTHDRMAFDRDYKSFFPLSVTRKSRKDEVLVEETVSLSQLAVGDRIVLRNGELIPADSKLMQGAAFIDYSFVTGESAPVAKSAGDYLYAGGKQTGAVVEVEIAKEVSQSYLTSLWNHEAFQKNCDDNFNTLTNRYSRRFTFVVISVAMGAGLFWTLAGNPLRGIKAFTSVLIVACPCALALAAPFTLGTAQRILARMGVFLRNALVIERMAQVDTVVFDKTGTLTTATSSGISFDGEKLDETEERWIYSLAKQSTHPLSTRISASLRNKVSAEEVIDFCETAGGGIEGQVDGHEIKLGSRHWVESHILSEVKNGEKQDACPTDGSSVCIVIDGKVRGTFVLANSIRTDIDQLTRKLSVEYDLALLSGDNESDRERFWNLFGNDEMMRFNQSPLDKLNFIRDVHTAGSTVMMVGDGLNDAGALKQSDVGVAVVEKIGTFSPASDVILEATQVPRLHEILTFARKSARIVRLSFGVSAAYNLIGISIAAAGILSPLICAVLMPISSISVVLFACGMTRWAARCVIKNSECRMTNGAESIADTESPLLSPFVIRHSSLPKA